MKKKIIDRYFTAAYLVLLVLCGCTREEGIGVPRPQATGKTVNVSLKVSIPPVVDPVAAGDASKIRSESQGGPGFVVRFADTRPGMQTRGSDGKTELHNLWLLQFNSDGTINGPAHKVSDKVTTVNDMVTLEVPMVVSTDQTLYLLVLGPKLECDPSSVTTLDNLEKMTLEYTVGQGGQTVSLVTRDEEIPLAGQVSGVTVVPTESGDQGLVEYNKPDGFAGGIEIKRLMSKISLRYKFEVPEYKLDGMKLLNANSVIRLSGNPDINTRDDRYVEITAASPTEPDAEGYRTVSWYVAQNRQGSVSSILAEKDRFNKVVNNVQSGNAPALGTNIEAWAYSTRNVNLYAIYQIYVGKNNTNNFDVDANSFYSLHTMIDMPIDAAQADGRIRAQNAAAQTVYLCSSWNNNQSNSYGFTGPDYDLDAHPDWRPLLVKARGRKVTIGIYTDEQCTQPADRSDSWLRVSSSPNYTEAYNNTSEPLDTRTETIVILPTELIFYLYSNEYVFGEDGSLAFREEDFTGNKRSLWIRVTTTSEGVIEGNSSTTTITYRMDQRPAAFMGNFGGKQLSDGYSLGLVYDRIVEYKQTYDGSGYKTKLVPYGYYKQSTTNAGYRTNDLSSGLEATRYLSENPKNLPFNIANLAGPQQDALGRVKLYQYSYYEVPAARYCYDRNRDENGNGVIDPEELKWYLPAANQAMGHWINLHRDETGTRDHIWTTTEYSETFGLESSKYSYIVYISKLSSDILHRCVRNVPLQKSSQQVKVVTDTRGNSYAAIKTSGMRRNLNRADEPNFYVTLNLYTENGGKSEQVLDSVGNYVMVRRMKRHSMTDPLEDNYSSNFMVAPENLSTRGISWAEANGYLSTANSIASTIEASAAPTGCPMYRGIDGKDPEGSWRVPTHKELALIMMYLDDLKNTEDRTGFTLSSNSTFWCAPESNPTGALSGEYSPDHPYTMSNSYGKSSTLQVRCIRDIP